jgi:hypothetical protein
MSGFGGQNNNTNQGADQGRPNGKEDVFNKVKFSSVKMGQTKQGSPTLGLYLKKDQMEKLHALLTELLQTQAGAEGCKIGCIVIAGKDYDSGYAYVNPKEPRREGQGGGQGNGQSQGFNGGNNRAGSNGGGYNRQPRGNFGNKDSARSFLQNKRIDDGKEGGSGN